MLETPLFGRFLGENRRLLFGPPEAYLLLMRLTLIVGAGLSLAPGVAPIVGFQLPLYQDWYMFTGAATFLAGVAAWMSLVRISFNLKERVYTCWRGAGRIPVRGRIDQIDAMVLIAEPRLGNIVYHLVLHWKERRYPPMIVQSDTRAAYPGMPLNHQAGPMVQLGMRYASALGIRFFDNSHIPPQAGMMRF